MLRILMCLVLGACASTDGNQEQQSPAKAPEPWSVSKGLSNPESAYYDKTTQAIYVSNVAGHPAEKDGKGWISKLSPTGQVIEEKWVQGLNAPKGLRSDGTSLWVSDIDQILAIDLITKKRRVFQVSSVRKGHFLNDVALDAEGRVYVSDTLGSAIYQVFRGKVSLLAKGPFLDHPNGLYVHEDRLFVASWGAPIASDFTTRNPGSIYSIKLGKSSYRMRDLVYFTEPLGNLDGLERLATGEWIVSDWISGHIYRVDGSGKATLFKSLGMGAADLGVLPGEGSLIVPQMMLTQLKEIRL